MFRRVRPLEPGVLGPGPIPWLDREVPRRLHSLKDAAPAYQPSDDLCTAINVALAVGAPLLLTGGPGTGKTQVAWWLAWYFGVPDEVFELAVKSTTAASELLYSFDTIQYFHDGQDPGRKGEKLDKRAYRTFGPLARAFDAVQDGKPAVVLIDEIDKAPRDFPNDLLVELDQYSFTIQETEEVIARPADRPPPTVIITSNDERRLPDAFLRRCIVHHLVFDADIARRAVRARRRDFGRLSDAVIERAIAVVLELHQVPAGTYRRLPAAGELLVWLTALGAMDAPAEALDGPRRNWPALGAILKENADLLRFVGG